MNIYAKMQKKILSNTYYPFSFKNLHKSQEETNPRIKDWLILKTVYYINSLKKKKQHEFSSKSRKST